MTGRGGDPLARVLDWLDAGADPADAPRESMRAVAELAEHLGRELERAREDLDREREHCATMEALGYDMPRDARLASWRLDASGSVQIHAEVPPPGGGELAVWLGSGRPVAVRLGA